MRHLGIDWDCLPAGSSFTIKFPDGAGGYALNGEWTITKMERTLIVVTFDEEGQHPTIPHPLDCVIEGVLTSRTSLHSYCINRGDIRKILESIKAGKLKTVENQKDLLSMAQT